MGMDVLLVEDEAAIREAVAEALREAGYAVSAAASAEEALQLVEAGGSAPRILVADLRLGSGMDGLALGAEVRRRWGPLGVIYATGNPEAFEGRLLGPSERYVIKPYTPAGLVQAMRRVVA
jgi:CheY-like chemotaxis protein